MMPRRAGAVLMVLMLTSCGPTKRLMQDREGREKQFAVWFRADVSHVRGVLAAPIDVVWDALPSTFEFLHFPVARSIYADEHVYITPSLKIERQLYEGDQNALYLNCGHTPAGVPIADAAYEVIFEIRTRLTPQADSGTGIDIVVDGTARDLTERSNAVPCSGTGRLEQMMIRQLEEALRAARP